MHRASIRNQNSADAAARDSLAENYEIHVDYIRSYLRGRVGSPELAEDLLQQTFLRLVQRADWLSVENPKAYTRTTASRVLADHYRSQSARKADQFVEYHEDHHRDQRSTPTRWMNSRQQLAQLEKALGSLSKQVRRAFVLSRVNGYTYLEVGEILSISPRTVEKHVAKGLATCFRFMNKLGAGSFDDPED